MNDHKIEALIIVLKQISRFMQIVCARPYSSVVLGAGGRQEPLKFLHLRLMFSDFCPSLQSAAEDSDTVPQT